MEKSQDELARAYATLSSLRKNIDEMTDYSVTETYVQEFHAVLDRLQGIIDIAEFRIPDSVVKPKITDVPATSNIGGGRVGHVSYSEEKYVERLFILTKLDAILGYFEIITSEKPKRMGFTN